ncbi:MAG TPA: hypothetical protein VKZ50_04765 [bacterium]|nr:hypothetical protein [bacterium]
MRAIALLVPTILILLTVSVGPGFADKLTVTLVSINSPIGQGQQQTIVVQTQSGATCGGLVSVGNSATGRGGSQTSAPLRDLQADDKGQVTWSWQQIHGYSAHYGVHITCKNGADAAVLDTGYDVK